PPEISSASSGAADPVPVFAQWEDSTGDPVEVLLQWHPGLPDKLPDAEGESLCTVQLCVASSPTPECFEARLQKQHLQQPLEAWSSRELTRLMTVMASSSASGDALRLRRAAGRMVIDVHFAAPPGCTSSSSAGVAGAGSLSGCVVEILNAYSSGTSIRGDILRFLRSAAAAQKIHRSAISRTTASLKDLRAEVERLESEWRNACVVTQKRHRGLLRRFALLLQAKIDKEQALHLAEENRRLSRMGAAAIAAPAPSGGISAERCLAAAKEEPRGRGGRGQRGRGRGGRGRAQSSAKEPPGGTSDRPAKRQKASAGHQVSVSPLALPASTSGGRGSAGSAGTFILPTLTAQDAGREALPPSLAAPSAAGVSCLPGTLSLFDPASSDEDLSGPASPGCMQQAPPATVPGTLPGTLHQQPEEPRSAAPGGCPSATEPVRVQGASDGRRAADLFWSDSDA
ncbi:unnamed protein product, partial [Polarella glacialis]